MEPLDFLRCAYDSVERTLGEILRHDYGPERSLEFYNECVARLACIKDKIFETHTLNDQDIAGILGELNRVSDIISLIERSHLGEFSWPFADQIRRIATSLFAEVDLEGELRRPIVHIIAEKRTYQIVPDAKARYSGSQPIIIVSFPRSMKHHVLLHSVFGHELGHIASNHAKASVAALQSKGPLSSMSALTSWFSEAEGLVNSTQTPLFDDSTKNLWVTELFCDLFGLLLFGPGFIAAYKAYLRPSRSNPYYVDHKKPTHPPYAVRHRMLIQAAHLLKWNLPAISSSETNFAAAERSFIHYIIGDNYSPLASVFTDEQIQTAIAGIRKLLCDHATAAYTPISGPTLGLLVRNLSHSLPPISAGIDPDGEPRLDVTPVSHILHAGWVYWIGRDNFPSPMDFFHTNRLCDQALLQNDAIRLTLKTELL